MNYEKRRSDEPIGCEFQQSPGHHRRGWAEARVFRFFCAAAAAALLLGCSATGGGAARGDGVETGTAVGFDRDAAKAEPHSAPFGSALRVRVTFDYLILQFQGLFASQDLSEVSRDFHGVIYDCREFSGETLAKIASISPIVGAFRSVREMQAMLDGIKSDSIGIYAVNVDGFAEGQLRTIPEKDFYTFEPTRAGTIGAADAGVVGEPIIVMLPPPVGSRGLCFIRRRAGLGYSLYGWVPCDKVMSVATNVRDFRSLLSGVKVATLVYWKEGKMAVEERVPFPVERLEALVHEMGK